MHEEKQVAIITGAASGIGKGIAFSLAEEGVFVIIADLSDNGELVAKKIKEEGNNANFYKVNVADCENVQSFIKSVDDNFGRIDILVNNAGIRPTKSFRDMVFEDWNKVLNINLNSVYHCCSAVLPIMERNNWGRIVSISSLAAQQGSTGGHSHYAASKAGIVGLSKSLAREYARQGITVNVVAPGLIDTPGWGRSLDGKRDQYAERVPVGRLGFPKDVANAVCFLTSDRAEYITGITLPVNGGLYIS